MNFQNPLPFSNRFLRDTSAIMFLNKQDILAEKVARGKSSLAKYFPDYSSYIPPGNCTIFQELGLFIK